MGEPAKILALPDFEGSVFEGYAVNYVNQNFWKVQYVFGDVEDAVSEAKTIYMKCIELYASRAKSHAHFMSLYKKMIFSYFIDWAKWDSIQRSILPLSEVEEAVEPEGPLMVALSEAGPELAKVLQIFINAPREIMDILAKEVGQTPNGVYRIFLRAVIIAMIPPYKAQKLQEELLTLLR